MHSLVKVQPISVTSVSNDSISYQFKVIWNTNKQMHIVLVFFIVDSDAGISIDWLIVRPISTISHDI